MLQENLVFNPVTDIQKVDPTGFIDLVKANETSSVPSNLVADEARFNEIDDPNSIGFRPRDEFEQQQANKAIVGYKPPKKSAPAEGSASAE